jgi:hypothetical protein
MAENGSKERKENKFDKLCKTSFEFREFIRQREEKRRKEKAVRRRLIRSAIIAGLALSGAILSYLYFF